MPNKRAVALFSFPSFHPCVHPLRVHFAFIKRLLTKSGKTTPGTLYPLLLCSVLIRKVISRRSNRVKEMCATYDDKIGKRSSPGKGIMHAKYAHNFSLYNPYIRYTSIRSRISFYNPRAAALCLA